MITNTTSTARACQLNEDHDLPADPVARDCRQAARLIVHSLVYALRTFETATYPESIYHTQPDRRDHAH